MPARAPELRLSVLFPHLILGGGETAMMAAAEGLAAHFDVSVCALARRPLTVEPSVREELAARFPGAAFVDTREDLAARLAAVDAVLWFGMNPFTPSALEAMDPRPVSVRVVHTDKREEGLDYHERWRHVVDAVACVSPAVQRRIPGAVFVPNACSPSRLRGPGRRLFPPAAPVRPAGPRRTLGYAGRLFGFKNVDWLVEHAADLDCDLAIQGLDTEELTRADLAALAARAGTSGRVAFLEPGLDVGTLLRSVDAVVLASRHEGFPMAVVEAGMLGVPVVATRVGALPELFADEILFVDLEEDGTPSLPSLRRALARLDPSWGRRLQRKVERLCSPEAVAGRYAELLRYLIRKKPALRAAAPPDSPPLIRR